MAAVTASATGWLRLVAATARRRLLRGRLHRLRLLRIPGLCQLRLHRFVHELRLLRRGLRLRLLRVVATRSATPPPSSPRRVPRSRTAGGESPRPRHWQSQCQGQGKDRHRHRQHQGGNARRRQVVRRWQVDRHAGGVADVLDAHPVPGPDVRRHLPAARKSCATAARRVTPGGWSSARGLSALRLLPRLDRQRHHGDRPGESPALNPEPLATAARTSRKQAREAGGGLSPLPASRAFSCARSGPRRHADPSPAQVVGHRVPDQDRQKQQPAQRHHPRQAGAVPDVHEEQHDQCGLRGGDGEPDPQVGLARPAL